jgi:hypothetical protein
MRQGVTFEEMFKLIDARLRLMQLSLTLWSWRVQGASEENLRDVEREYGKALDRLWEAQTRCF